MKGGAWRGQAIVAQPRSPTSTSLLCNHSEQKRKSLQKFILTFIHTLRWTYQACEGRAPDTVSSLG